MQMCPMLDIHSHILPKLDDGSKSTEESLEMLRLLKSQNVAVVAATPHFYAWENDPDRFLRHREAAYTALMEAAADEENLPKILLGAEVHYFPGISKTDVTSLFKIQNSRLLLLEMPFSKWTDSMTRELIEMSDNPNFTLLLAHIERYLGFTDTKTLDLLRQRGVLIQMNAHFFQRFATRRKALSMLKTGQVHMIGTDSHNMTTRKPNMDIFEQAVTAKLGEAFLKQFVRAGFSYLEESV